MSGGAYTLIGSMLSTGYQDIGLTNETNVTQVTGLANNDP